MRALPRRLGALGLVAAAAAPLLAAGLPAPREARRPFGWIAIPSIDRIERRLREHVDLAGGEGREGFLAWLHGATEGADRSRPVAVALAGVDLREGEPAWIAVVPCEDRKKIGETLKGLFGGGRERGPALELGPGMPPSAFARFADGGRTVVVSNALVPLLGAEPELPADLFGAGGRAGECDVAMRLHLQTLKGRHPVLVRGLLESLDRAGGAGDPGGRALAGFLRGLLEDLVSLEARATLDPGGWGIEVRARPAPDSRTAAVLKAQSDRPALSADLFSAGSAVRVAAGLRLSKEDRAWLVDRVADLRKSLGPALEPADGVAARGFGLLERAAGQPALEAGFEAIPAGREIEATGWVALKDARSSLEALLDSVERELPAAARAGLARGVDRAGETPIHRLSGLPRARPSDPEAIFFAAEGDFLLFHAGAAPDPLKAALGRLRARGTRILPTTDAILRVEFPPAEAAEAGFFDPGPGKGDPFAWAWSRRLLRAAGEPASVELLAEEGSAVVRLRLSRPFVAALMETAGEQGRIERARGAASP